MVAVDSTITARTERLLLRPLSMEDAHDMWLMRKDPEVMKHTSLGPSDDIETTKAWIEGCIESPVKWIFAIELLNVVIDPQQLDGSPQVIGIIGAVREPGEIGYMFKTAFWGKGYATEALRGFLPLFFDHYPGNGETCIEFAQANTDSELVKSQNVLIKTGFVLYEKRIKNFESPTLGWRDIWVYRKYRTQ